MVLKLHFFKQTKKKILTQPIGPNIFNTFYNKISFKLLCHIIIHLEARVATTTILSNKACNQYFIFNSILLNDGAFYQSLII